MNTFANAVKNQESRTENGMVARSSTASSTTDLFFKIGASRGKDIIPQFVAAYVQDKDIAVRTALWARDARNGAGERQLYRDILVHLAKNDPEVASRLINKTVELGRWDDLLVLAGTSLQKEAFDLYKEALENGDGLAAKWAPRKGPVANALRNHFGYSPKFYRKRLVELTKVVEQQMCAKDWDNINFSHVPSVAAARYKKAFNRNTPKYAEYVAALVKGDDPKVKVNAGAVYPYDVIKGVYNHGSYNKTELDLVTAQWEALPNFIGEANVLAVVDVSGSMHCKAGGRASKSEVLCIDVALSLGLYCADKNKGKFKDTFLTFSSEPELLHLNGNIVQKLQQMDSSSWDMSTDLHAAMEKILSVAKQGQVPNEEMPQVLLIMSDMQFDHCVRHDDSAMQMIARKYDAAGYEIPKVVFWNINAYDNVPVKFDKSGTALVSGFSPAILKSILGGDLDHMTPEAIMKDTVCVDRYDW